MSMFGSFLPSLGRQQPQSTRVEGAGIVMKSIGFIDIACASLCTIPGSPRKVTWHRRALLDTAACAQRLLPASFQPDIRYPSASKPLKVIIDKLYQYAIMASIGRQDSSRLFSHARPPRGPSHSFNSWTSIPAFLRSRAYVPCNESTASCPLLP